MFDAFYAVRDGVDDRFGGVGVCRNLTNQRHSKITQKRLRQRGEKGTYRLLPHLPSRLRNSPYLLW